MIENEHNHHSLYWKGIQPSWLFWVVLFFTFASIIYYIMSVDFAFAPQRQLEPPSENNKTQ